MSIAQYYSDIYLLIITLLTYVLCRKRGEGYIVGKEENLAPSAILCLFLILVIGLRPIHAAFVDTLGYAESWSFHDEMSFKFDFYAENVIFDNLYAYIDSLGCDISVFFLVIAFIYFGGILVTCRKLFPDNTLLAFVVYLGAFSTFAYGTNGIKAGAAASLFLLALAYRDKVYLSVPLALVSWGFHHSMQMPVAVYIMTFLFKDCKWYFILWCFCFGCAVGHITFFQEIFAGLTDERGAEYLLIGDFNMSGRNFRIDFIIYSLMPVLMGYLVKYKYQLQDKLYDIMLNMYLACNGVWMLCMYASYTNRIAYLSWFLYPILIIYPSLTIDDPDHPLVIHRNKFVGWHLCFTLVMHFVYYKIRFS